MAAVRDRCICLRHVEYSETSQVLLLFARDHGLQRLIAKGAHRRTKAGASKFDGGVDLLDLGDAVFIVSPQRDLGTLTEWKLVDGHLGLRRSLRAMYLALYGAELVGLLIEEHDPHPEIFQILETTLAQLSGPRIEEAFIALELQLLQLSGYLPELRTCCNCQRPIEERGPCSFSAPRGGLVCRTCQGPAEGVPFDTRLLAVIHAILSGPRWPRLTRHQSDPINRLLAAHLRHTLGKDLRMAPHVL